jgi:AraC-like DNA-binding protein
MIVVNQKFAIDLGWAALLKDLNLAEQDLLRYARLPLDLFSQRSPTLTTEEYFRLWQGVEYLFDDPAFPLRLGQAVSVETFSPPIFACFCSANLNAAFTRLAQYKPLIGPLTLKVTQSNQQTTISFDCLPGNIPLPSSLIATELVFLVHMVRLATRERIMPTAVSIAASLPKPEQYESFFGVRIEQGNFNGLTFAAKDAQKPFLTANENMWSFFEPELNRRVADLGLEDRFRDRVRACLMEILASGQCTMADVSQRLAVSPRTLQRRLHKEETSFQQELSNLRAELANHYLVNSHYSSTEIAFLLGYNDASSFFRAFHTWTGKTPEGVREILYS